MSTLKNLIRGGAIAAVVSTCAWAQDASPAVSPTAASTMPAVPGPRQNKPYLPKATFGTGATVSKLNAAPGQLDPGLTAESIGQWQRRAREQADTAAMQRRERARGQTTTAMNSSPDRTALRRGDR
ncbi:hypothetical protein K0B96_14460 [Horticoccus luteus]|uniref:Uncharacterized protein n=1 Tax=Horticoccus luteus TaxID=2862869 RepID=A0A8F9XJB4_9BACT|nr:hypothetical protein [Horticoccus luteus]QYM78488.1 hypothetical protein K0B96_14460 [Horticoccus luteus]